MRLFIEVMIMIAIAVLLIIVGEPLLEEREYDEGKPMMLYGMYCDSYGVVDTFPIGSIKGSYTKSDFNNVSRTCTVTRIDFTDSTVTVFHRMTSGYSSCGGDIVYVGKLTPPVVVWKDVYKVRRGKIVKDTTIRAEVTPEYIE